MKITEKNYNIQTGEETITERDETPAEKQERETQLAEALALKAQSEARAATRKSVLDRLGLTEEEAAILLG
jgi:hypothetical protein